MILKKYVFIPFSVLTLICGSVQAQTSSCSNADFELNSFAGWSGTTGICCPINSTLPGIVPGRHTIMTGGTDINTNNALSCVAPGGNFSVRLGNDNTNSEAEQLSYTFLVTPQTQLFVYRYAVVLQDPGHPVADQPRFEIRVFDQNGDIDSICGLYSVVAADGIPGFISIPDPFDPFNTIHYKDWTTVGIDLSSKMGSTITIEFSTGDCAQGAHYGYAYIDCMCYPFNILADFCAGSFTATLTAPPGFSAYAWSTGETTQSINIINPVIGDTFNVVMTSVTGCQVSLNSIIRESIVASAYHLLDSCYNNTLFIDSSYVISGSPINAWQWDFGDGITSTLQNPNHVYSSPGNYNITLIITNQGGCKYTTNLSVHVRDIPIPLFGSVPVCPGNPMQFLDSTTTTAPATLISWDWDFGDGTISTAQNPVHIYNLPGTYSVTLVAEDNYGCRDTSTLPTSTIAAPVAGFKYTTNCSLPDVQFNDTTIISGGAITSWSWDFGDASPISNLQNPLHTYPGPGSYTVILTTVVNGVCIDTASLQVTIQNPPLVTFSNLNACAKSKLEFTDLSSLPGNTITAWTWDFGDGTANSFLQNPVHQYNNTGTYAVTLTATASNGCIGTKTDSVKILASPSADFGWSQICPGQSGFFTDSTTFTAAGGNSWSWNFGDGSGWSNTQNSQHIFAIGGTYGVTLAVLDNNGCRDTTLEYVITAIAPVCRFIIPTGCQNGLIYFQSTSAIATGTIDSTIWDFGDGSAVATGINVSHVFATSALFPVTLTTISMAGCSNSVMHEVYVKAAPAGNFTAPSLCLGKNVNFTDQTLPGDGVVNYWHWDFGDGATATSQNSSHIYNIDSLQTIRLIVNDTNGCSDTAIKVINVFPLPIPDFTTGLLCENTPVQFNNSVYAPTGILNMIWEFGDASPNSVALNPVHTYVAGNYQVMLHTMDNNGCTDSVSKPIQIQPLPVASFSPSNQCIYSPVSFQNTSTISTGSINIYVYNFGDLNVDSVASTSHLYTSSGNYPVTLNTISTAGCVDDTTITISVHPKPVADFNWAPVCEQQPAQFTSLSTVRLGDIIGWNWNFGDNTPNGNTEDPSHIYAATNSYTVTLIVTSDSLCTDTTDALITIYPIPVPAFITDTVCKGVATQFTNQSSVSSGNVTSAQWNFNSIASDTAYHPSFVSPVDGTFPATLIAITNNGCTDSITNPVKVYALPVPDFIADVRTGCEPLDVAFTNQSFSTDGIINMWFWTFGDRDSDTLEDVSHQYVNDGLYDVSLTVVTDLTCTDSIIKPGYITVHPLP